MVSYLKTSAIAFDLDVFYNQQDSFKNGLQNNSAMREFLHSLKKDHQLIAMHWNDKFVAKAARELKNDRLVDDYIVSPAYNEKEEQSFCSVPLKYNIDPDNTLFLLSGFSSYNKAKKEKLQNIRCLRIQETNALKDSFFNEKNEIHLDSRKTFNEIKEEVIDFSNKIKTSAASPL